MNKIVNHTQVSIMIKTLLLSQTINNFYLITSHHFSAFETIFANFSQKRTCWKPMNKRTNEPTNQYYKLNQQT